MAPAARKKKSNTLAAENEQSCPEFQDEESDRQGREEGGEYQQQKGDQRDKQQVPCDCPPATCCQPLEPPPRLGERFFACSELNSLWHYMAHYTPSPSTCRTSYCSTVSPSPSIMCGVSARHPNGSCCPCGQTFGCVPGTCVNDRSQLVFNQIQTVKNMIQNIRQTVLDSSQCTPAPQSVCGEGGESYTDRDSFTTIGETERQQCNYPCGTLPCDCKTNCWRPQRVYCPPQNPGIYPSVGSYCYPSCYQSRYIKVPPACCDGIQSWGCPCPTTYSSGQKLGQIGSGSKVMFGQKNPFGPPDNNQEASGDASMSGRDPYFNGQLEDKFMTGNFLGNGEGGGRGKTMSNPKSPSPRSPPGPSLNEKEDDDETIMPRISLSPAKVPAVDMGSGKGRSGRGTLKKGMGIRGGAMPGGPISPGPNRSASPGGSRHSPVPLSLGGAGGRGSRSSRGSKRGSRSGMSQGQTSGNPQGQLQDGGPPPQGGPQPLSGYPRYQYNPMNDPRIAGYSGSNYQFKPSELVSDIPENPFHSRAPTQNRQSNHSGQFESRNYDALDVNQRFGSPGNSRGSSESPGGLSPSRGMSRGGSMSRARGKSMSRGSRGGSMAGSIAQGGPGQSMGRQQRGLSMGGPHGSISQRGSSRRAAGGSMSGPPGSMSQQRGSSHGGLNGSMAGPHGAFMGGHPGSLSQHDPSIQGSILQPRGSSHGGPGGSMSQHGLSVGGPQCSMSQQRSLSKGVPGGSMSQRHGLSMGGHPVSSQRYSSQGSNQGGSSMEPERGPSMQQQASVQQQQRSNSTMPMGRDRGGHEQEHEKNMRRTKSFK